MMMAIITVVWRGPGMVVLSISSFLGCGYTSIASATSKAAS